MELLGGPYGWFCEVKARATGKPFTYWINNANMPRIELAAHFATHFPNVEFLSCQPALSPPDGTRLRHVPPEHFQFGVLKKIEEEMLAGGASSARLPIHRIPRRRLR